MSNLSLSKIPSSRFEALSMLKGRNKKKVVYQTWLKKDGDTINLIHWSTAIVRWHLDGRIEVNTGGRYSLTTRRRIGAATGLYIYSDRGRPRFRQNDIVYEFDDDTYWDPNKRSWIGSDKARVQPCPGDCLCKRHGIFKRLEICKCGRIKVSPTKLKGFITTQIYYDTTCEGCNDG